MENIKKLNHLLSSVVDAEERKYIERCIEDLKDLHQSYTLIDEDKPDSSFPTYHGKSCVFSDATYTEIYAWHINNLPTNAPEMLQYLDMWYPNTAEIIESIYTKYIDLKKSLCKKYAQEIKKMAEAYAAAYAINAEAD